MYLLGATGMLSNNKPVGISLKPHANIPDCTVVVRSARPVFQRHTTEDPYLSCKKTATTRTCAKRRTSTASRGYAGSYDGKSCSR